MIIGRLKTAEEKLEEKDSEKAGREVELKIFEMEERRQKESQDFQMRLLSLLQIPKIQPQVSNIHGTSNMQAQDLSCDMYSNDNLYSNPMTYNSTVFVIC